MNRLDVSEKLMWKGLSKGAEKFIQTPRTTVERLNILKILFSKPLHIQYDDDREYDIAILRHLCKLFDIKLTYSSVKDIQSNEPVERFHCTLIGLLRIYNAQNPDEHSVNIALCNNLL